MDRQEVRGERRGTRGTCSLCPLWVPLIGLFRAWRLAQARWDTLTSYLKTRLNDLLTRSHTWHRSEGAGTEGKRGGREFDVLAQYASLISRRTSWPWQVLGVNTARFEGEKQDILQRHRTSEGWIWKAWCHENLQSAFPRRMRDCRLRFKPTNSHQESAVRVGGSRKGRSEGIKDGKQWIDRRVEKLMYR